MAVTLIAAIVLGFLTGLGIGGGSLLILWLTLVLEYDPVTARGINLLFFLPAAVISCLFRLHQGKLDLKRSLPAILSGCAAALFFSLIGARMDTSLLKKAFGALLLITGLRELTYRSKKKLFPSDFRIITLISHILRTEKEDGI